MSFEALLLKDYLEAFPTPAFVIDLFATLNTTLDESCIAYANVSATTSPSYQRLVEPLKRKMTMADRPRSGFWAWATVGGEGYGKNSTPYTCDGIQWIKSSLKARWRVFSGRDGALFRHWEEGKIDMNSSSAFPDTVIDPNDRQSHGDTLQTSAMPLLPEQKVNRSGHSESTRPAETAINVHDWISRDAPIDPDLPARLAPHIDLSKTGLGPVHSWSPEFRTMWNFVMSDSKCSTLIWGPDRRLYWNEAYGRIIVPEFHPVRFGYPFKDVFPEVPAFYDYFDMIEKTGRALTQEDAEFHLTVNGVLQETYYDFSLIPIFQSNKLVGLFNPAYDVTRQHISERRMATLIRLGESIAANRDLKQFWSRVVRALKYYEHDFPFAAIYSVSLFVDESDTASNTSDMSRRFLHSLPKLNLEGSVGIPDGHPAARHDVDLRNGVDGFEPYLVQSARSGEVVVLHTYDGTLPESLHQDIRCGKFKDPCRTIVILPIKHRTGAENIGGFIILGLNPRRPYGPDYHDFFKLLSQLLGASMANTVLVEEEMRSSRTAAKRAAMDQAILQQELARTVREAKRLEMQFTHFADRAPIGINIFRPDGKLLYANEVWYDLTAYDRSQADPMGWMKDAFKAGSGDSQDVWHALLTDKSAVTFECRMKRPGKDSSFHAGHDRAEFTWILASVFPEISPFDGSVESITGCFMDISQQKWVEELQTRRMNEAIEAKKMQENFIDMTSHEMRNPLSAIIHCCDGIIDALESDSGTSSALVQVSQEAIANSLEAARTILHCSAHQKRIVDDILVLSKIESDLLPIAPANVQIRKEVENILAMFQVELKSVNITLEYDIHESFKRLEVDHVFVDPSRLAQVFINLMTNAIKFTRTEETRRIKVRLAASLERPETSRTGIRYIPPKHVDMEDITSRQDWGNGDIIYLQFSVADTGSGLTQFELEHLFGRFAQASPRTHVRYGGSGLGLYIARELTEKQGGSIGATSEAGKGSTFAFFVKARRAPALTTENHVQQPMLRARVDTDIPVLLSQTMPENPLQSAPPLKSSNTKPKHDKDVSNSAAARFPILIVEDNVVNRSVLKKQLSRLGYPIYESNHGEEALAFLQSSRFWAGQENTGQPLSMVLMDLEMPVMDGLTCVREIRKLQGQGILTSHVPTIAVTANARSEQIQIAIGAGMDKVVCKPFRIPELVEQMGALASECEGGRGQEATLPR